MRLVAKIVVIALVTAYLPIPALAQSNSVNIVSPSNSDTLSGDRAEVSASYHTDSARQVTRVELDVDGTRYGVKQLNQASSRGVSSFLVDTTKLGNGAHKFVLKAFSGKKLVGSTSGSYNVGNDPVDVVGPDVRVIGIRNHQVISGVTEIEIKAKDNGKDNPLVSIYVDKTLRVIKNVPPYTFEWDSSEVGDGTHVIKACAYDAAGNRSDSNAICVSVQNTMAKATEPATQPKVAEAPTKCATTNGSVVTIAQNHSEPLIPSGSTTKTSAARSDNPEATISARTNGPATKLDHPVSPVQTSSSVATTSSKVDSSEVCPNEEPTSTAPSMIKSGAASNIVESTPAETAAPTVTVKPASGAESPSMTIASANVPIDQSNLRTVMASAAIGQKLASPAEPQPKPVKTKKTKIQPSREAHKFKIKLETKKHKGLLFTELRSVIESTGGTIIAWDKRTKIVMGTVNGKSLKLHINGKIAVIDGQSVQLKGAPYVNERGRTVVDVQFLKSLVGTRLEVNANTGEYMLVTG